jgi:hypothetical protein
MFVKKFHAPLAVSLSAVLCSSGAFARNSVIDAPPSGPPFAQASSSPAVSLRETRNLLDTYLKPSSQATRELQSGLQRLGRVCELGKPAPQGHERSLIELKSQVKSAHVELMGVELNLQQVLNAYTQNSRITRLQACRYVPTFVPLSFTCEGFRQDSARLAVAEKSSLLLVNEARQRLDFYDQLMSLEIRGCTRTGFTMKLWETEQTYLWPTLTGFPGFLGTVLSTTAVD